MTKDPVEIGFVFRTHGVRGHLKIHLDETIQELAPGQALFLLKAGRQIPYFIKEIEYLDTDSILVLFEEIQSKEEASLFMKKPVLADPSIIIEQEAEEAFTYEGYTVFDEQGKKIGAISAVHEMEQYELAEVDYNGKIVLIPLPEAFILATDDAEKTLQLRLPEGLLEL